MTSTASQSPLEIQSNPHPYMKSRHMSQGEEFQFQLKNEFYSIQVQGNRFNIEVFGKINDTVKNSQIEYLASAPADYNNSFSGSGMPFPSAEVAFSNTVNRGTLKTSGSSFRLSLLMPNAYYDNSDRLGNNNLINPEVMVKYSNGKEERTLRIPLGNRIVYRSHNYPAIRDQHKASFYDTWHSLPVRGQEQILRDSGYPEQTMVTTPINHWGLKPAN